MDVQASWVQVSSASLFVRSSSRFCTSRTGDMSPSTLENNGVHSPASVPRNVTIISEQRMGDLVQHLRLYWNPQARRIHPHPWRGPSVLPWTSMLRAPSFDQLIALNLTFTATNHCFQAFLVLHGASRPLGNDHSQGEVSIQPPRGASSSPTRREKTPCRLRSEPRRHLWRPGIK